MLTKEELIELVMRSWCDEEGDLNLRLEVNLEDGWYITEEEVREAVQYVYMDYASKAHEFQVNQAIQALVILLFDEHPSDLIDDSEEKQYNYMQIASFDEDGVSLSQGDVVIAPDGNIGEFISHSDPQQGLEVYAEVGYLKGCGGDTYSISELVDPKQPLRVRVGSEEEARELADLCTDAGFDVHWFMDLDLASHLHIELSKNNADIWHNSDKEHDVEWNDRKPQVRKYIKYHSTEDEMTEQTDDELTHEPYQADHPDDAANECAFCGRLVADWNDPCPEHPDREDDESTEREIAEAEFNLLRSNIKQIHRVADTALSDLDALRSQLELGDDDGVCEWTENENGDWETGCDFVLPGDTHFAREPNENYCQSCGGEIEIVEEGERFQVGDLIKWRGKYRIIIDTDTEYGEYEVEGDKVGHFQPTDDFFERVPEECNGSLVIANDQVMFDPVCRTEYRLGSSYEFYTENGDSFRSMGAKATGIILSVSELEPIFCEEE